MANLVHDLRQPLGNIETSIYLLSLLTPSDQGGAHAQIRCIERQVNQAARLLSEAAAALTRLQAQRVEAAESLDLTNEARAVVT
jgi:signal transduction histidine kinase